MTVGQRSWQASCVLVAVLAVACGQITRRTERPVPTSGTGHVLVFSDLHFDPFSDPALVDTLAHADVARWRAIFGASVRKAPSRAGHDVNFPLFASALAAMQRADPAPELVLFAGDVIAHNFQSVFRKTARDTSAAALGAFTDKLNQFVARQLADAFPRAQILVALGNNDAACGNYMSQPGSAFLRSFATTWEPLVNRRGSAPDFVETFSRAGHYAVRAPSIDARVVVLNDVYWSPRYANSCGSRTDRPGRDALAWLDSVLADSRSRGERVWLLTHIPVGVDVFATLKADTLVNMLDPAYARELVSLLRRFAPIVRYGLYGHTHMNAFRVVTDSSGPLLGNLGIPALSPIYGNNPAFTVLSVDATSGAVTDFAVHTLSNLPVAVDVGSAHWSTEYDFAENFGAGGLAASKLAQVHRTLATDSVARARFIRFYDSGSGSANVALSWRAHWCAITNVDPAAFERCRRGE